MKILSFEACGHDLHASNFLRRSLHQTAAVSQTVASSHGMHPRWCMLAIVSAFALMLIVMATGPSFAQKKFSFFAIGDMPYNNPRDLERFHHLISEINGQHPSFTVHVGDIKNGKSECSNDYYETIFKTFGEFRDPLIYTPGDNEWTDCGRPACGGYDAGERLNALRTIFFARPETLGQKTFAVTPEAASPGFEKFVENVRWTKEGVTFATLNVVGSNNNLKKAPASNDEFYERDKANVFWLHDTFRAAKAHKDAAVVLFMQASMDYKPAETNGFNQVVRTLRDEVVAFGKPVLLVYGDLHHLLISKPLKDSANNLIPNFTALMVFGEMDMNAVKIDVDAKSASVFSFSEFLIDYH